MIREGGARARRYDAPPALESFNGWLGALSKVSRWNVLHGHQMRSILLGSGFGLEAVQP